MDKRDSGKAPLSFLSALRGPLSEVAKVLEFGNAKYKNIRNYRTIENGERRYLDAALRHIWAAADGESLDPESGLPHLAHGACDVLMALWFHMENK